jgi:NADH:ubiquinone oxidoreductase subunit F (NADH-binding)
MATEDADSVAPPVLVNNVETLANVPAIVAEGATWFRSLGTQESPGTIVCTVTGAVDAPGVFEVPMGVTLADVIDLARAQDEGSNPTDVAMVLLGTSNAVITADRLRVPLTYEDFAAIGSGLGSAGFIVIDGRVHPVAVAAGASRFLAVESCGQCTPCKGDGLEIASILGEMCAGRGEPEHLVRIDDRLEHVVEGARCSLATQQQVVIGSLRRAFASRFDEQSQPGAAPVEPVLVAELLEIDGSRAVVDESFATKQPDWTDDEVDSGESPASRLADHRIA